MMDQTQTRQKVASTIEHTLLKSESTPEDFVRLFEEASRLQVYGTCVPSRWVSFLQNLIIKNNSPLKITAVVGFPLGNQLTDVKVRETELCCELGASEIDMVLSVGELKAGELKTVEHDIAAVVQAAKARPVKVIVEAHLLTAEELVASVRVGLSAGARYIKTCTGFTGGAATVEMVQAMRKALGESGVRIKASGGIRTWDQAVSLLNAGATRLGLSNAKAVLQNEASTRGDY